MRIIYNAKIYSLDDLNTTYSALVIDRGRILAVGNDDLRLEFPGSSPSHDLGGRPVIPGLTDAHLHLQHFSLGLQKVDCEVDSKEECLRRVAERAASTPLGNWILGHGWNQNRWEDGFGTATDLENACPHHPVYLTAKSLHAGWANHSALRAARIDARTPDPVDGKIQRDEHGNPTGILLEGAMKLISESIPEPPLNEVVDSIRNAQTVLWEMGITGVHDFDRQLCFSALQTLHNHGGLKLRVLKSIPLESLPQAVEIGLRSGFGDNWLWIGGIKAFMDGALGPHTAAMFQPYKNAPGNRGMLLMDSEELQEHGRLAVENGLSLAIHAIGDHANHEVLNAFEHLREYEKSLIAADRQNPLRHRIEHVQILHPKDVNRLGELGIIASMQPSHATSDMLMADEYWGTRASLSYALKSQLDHDAVLALGSDAPVETPNPFWGIHAAITRRRANGSPGESGWYPEQRLSVREALAGFTTGAAFAAGKEHQMGKLSPGYFADLLVLDTDIFGCDPHEIKDIQPAATMVGGEWVFDSGII